MSGDVVVLTGCRECAGVSAGADIMKEEKRSEGRLDSWLMWVGVRLELQQGSR